MANNNTNYNNNSSDIHTKLHTVYGLTDAEQENLKLTPDQLNQIPVFKNKWLNMALGESGVSRVPKHVSVEDAEAAADWLYTCAKQRKPLYTLQFKSPVAMQLAANYLCDLPWKSMVRAGTEVDLSSFILPDLVKNTVHNYSKKNLAKELATAIFDYYKFNSYKLGMMVTKTWANKVAKESVEQYYPVYVPTACIGLGYDAGWAAHYEYCTTVLGESVPSESKEDAIKRLAVCYAGIWDCIPLGDVFLTCDAPALTYRTEGRALIDEDHPIIWGDDTRSTKSEENTFVC